MTEAKNKIKCYVVGGYSPNFCDFIENSETTNNIEKADIVIFTGGEDINPAIYGQEKHPSTSTPNKFRDEFEITMFNIAKTLKKPVFGICRGAQLCGALSGATLVQHQVGSGGNHPMRTSKGEELHTTHAHHQSLNLDGLKISEYELLAWDESNCRCYGENWNDLIQRNKHPEYVFFPKTRVLAYQGHPEWMSGEQFNETKLYINETIREKFNL